MKPPKIQKEIELTIASLDRLSKASAPIGFNDKVVIEILLRNYI